MADEELRQEIEQLRAEIDRVDEWATGLFQVLVDVLHPILKMHPEVAAAVAPHWRHASERFDAVEANTGQLEDVDETVERLEARKMLYRMFAIDGLWPRPGIES